jgi:hypothetical protein
MESVCGLCCFGVNWKRHKYHVHQNLQDGTGDSKSHMGFLDWAGILLVDGMWIGEGENEAIRMCFASATDIPWNRRITTKEESLIAVNDGECGSFVVTVFVKISWCEPISKMVVWTKMKEEWDFNILWCFVKESKCFIWKPCFDVILLSVRNECSI